MGKFVEQVPTLLVVKQSRNLLYAVSFFCIVRGFIPLLR